MSKAVQKKNHVLFTWCLSPSVFLRQLFFGRFDGHSTILVFLVEQTFLILKDSNKKVDYI